MNDMDNIIEKDVDSFLDYSILKMNNIDLRVGSILNLLIFCVAVFVILKMIRFSIFRSTKLGEARKYSIYSLLKYLILIGSTILSFSILGFDVSVILAGSAALLVVLGLGIQNLFNDYISGIIILVDSSVKVGDIIEIEGIVGKVQTINLRTTTVLTRDDKYIILPNSILTKQQLINWTHSKITSRFRIEVGVDYGSNVQLVISILEKAAVKNIHTVQKPKPYVDLVNYGESSINFILYFWSNKVFEIERIKSEIRIEIFENFRKNKVTIPFPQRVIHRFKAK